MENYRFLYESKVNVSVIWKDLLKELDDIFVWNLVWTLELVYISHGNFFFSKWFFQERCWPSVILDGLLKTSLTSFLELVNINVGFYTWYISEVSFFKIVFFLNSILTKLPFIVPLIYGFGGTGGTSDLFK